MVIEINSIYAVMVCYKADVEQWPEATLLKVFKAHIRRIQSPILSMFAALSHSESSFPTR